MQNEDEECGAPKADGVEQQSRHGGADERAEGEGGRPHARHQTVGLYGVGETARTKEDRGG